MVTDERPVTVIGNVNLDVIVRGAAELPPPGEEWLAEEVTLRPGGAAANAALALAALGVPVRLIGCVGADGAGHLVREALASVGVGLDDVTTLLDASTGVSVAFEAPGRDRSFLTYGGALARFDETMVPADAFDGGAVLVCGTFLLPGLGMQGTRSLLSRAHDAGATVLFDPGSDPDGWHAATRDAIIGLLPLVDLFLPNAQEAAALTGEETEAKAARRLQIGTTIVVVKTGADGAVMATPGGEVVSVRAPLVDVLDTTGAGDALDAALIAALRRGRTLAEGLGSAVRFASTVVGRPSGDRFPKPGHLI
jgi:sugar/nucleoside kinase (ribokinase family)